MSTYDLEEQEQLAELKTWWKRYGNAIVLGVVLAAVLLTAYTGWRFYQRGQGAQASTIYSELVKAAGAKDNKKVRDLAGALIAQYPRTEYASLGMLLSAKAQFDAGDLKTAQVQLGWVVDNAANDEVRAMARVRLAGVLLDQKAYDDALKVLAAKAPAEFAGMFDDARGDVLVAKGAKAEARAAYKSALENLGRVDGATRELIQLKLDALGEN